MGGREHRSEPAAGTGCYVYGIVPADLELAPGATGVAGAEVRLVRHGDIAALVSDVDLGARLGTPDDLVAHQRLLDAIAPQSAVLPFRFGGVVAGEGAVAEELLAANHDQFAAALDELDGRVEYLVRARYVEPAVLAEVLAEDPRAARLREEVRQAGEAADPGARIRLGELVHAGISAKRAADTARVIERLAPYALAGAEREPSHRQDAAYVAFLVETEQGGRFTEAVGELAEEWRDRAEVDLYGPLAPYDFLVTGTPADRR